MTRKCTKCHLHKDETEYRLINKAKGRLSSWCKLCFSAYEREKWKTSPERRESNKSANKKRKTRNSQFVWDFLKTKACMDCSEPETILLEFDHRDRSTKKFCISEAVRSSVSIETLKKEMNKCDVVCGNCHKRRTVIQMGYYKDIIT